MFAVEKLNVKNRSGLEICIVCDRFGARSEINSNEIVLDFFWKVCTQSIEPFRNVENPTPKDYYYEQIVGVAEGVKTYSNADLRVDLEIVNGVPTPKFEQAKDELGNLLFEEDGVTPIMIPVMIGNIDFWLKFGGDGILADLAFTLSQIKQQPINTFIKDYVL